MHIRHHLLRWGAAGAVSAEARFSDTNGLLSALDRITFDAITSGCIQSAELHTAPVSMDPLLIQFTVGHVDRATLLWHLDGQIVVADTSVGDEHAQRDDGAIHPQLLRQALIVYVLTDERPAGVRWREVCGD